MNAMERLLANLGSKWNKLPKDVPAVSIQKNTGVHSMVTVDKGVLVLHSAPYRSDMPQKQSVVLEDLTVQELIDTVNSMGYTSTITSEATNAGINLQKSYVLTEVTGAQLPATLGAFTSTVWTTLYPIYRVLENAGLDTDAAIKQFRSIHSAGGMWIDYWATFFAVKREMGESDNSFVKRILTWLFNPKTNNIALEELLNYRLNDRIIKVNDRASGEFEVTLDVSYSGRASELHAILLEAKAAGIEYFLNYVVNTVFSEDYKSYLADVIGKPFSNMATSSVTLEKAGLTEVFVSPSEAGTVTLSGSKFMEIFQLYSSNYATSFTLDDNTYSVLDETAFYDDNVVADMLTMTLTQGGTVIRSQSM